MDQVIDMLALSDLLPAIVTVQVRAVLRVCVAPHLDQVAVPLLLAHAAPLFLGQARSEGPPRLFLAAQPAAEVGLVARQDLVAFPAVAQLILGDPAVGEPEDEAVG